MILDHFLYWVKQPWHFFKTGVREGWLAEVRYRWPARKLNVIAFTGTDGKTTSATLMYHVLKSAGYKVVLLSTVAAYVGDEEIETGFHVTSPSPRLLHQLLRRVVDQGYTYLVLEVTSHGLYQYRTWGIKPLIAGVTNIHYEHLDYHLNYENYVEAKSRLFKRAKLSVLNEDDHSYHRLRRLLKGSKTQIATYSRQDRLSPVIKKAIDSRFPEQYNRMNARLVTMVARSLDMAPAAIAAGLASFPGVPGRMQEIPNNRGLRIIVDFAHTPQGLEAALTAARQQLQQQPVSKRGKLIAVFGCAGLRDRVKRPVMGKIGATIADLAVFTAEDPRTENVWTIIRQMKEDLGTNYAKVTTIPDRQAAINFAINSQAKRGDTVIILGKGHERSMCFGTTEYPWSDSNAVQEALQQTRQSPLVRS